MEELYTYIYLDPRKKGSFSYDGIDMSFLFEPFYVGKGKKDRIDQHLDAKRKTSKQWKKNVNKARIIYDIFEQGLEPIRFILEKCGTKEDQQKSEYRYINSIGRKLYNHGPLTNVLPGKDTDNPGERRKGKTLEELFGKEKADEWKQKMKQSSNPLMNPGHLRKGKTLRESWKRNIREATKGKKNPMSGISMIQRLINKWGEEIGKQKYEQWKQNKRKKQINKRKKQI